MAYYPQSAVGLNYITYPVGPTASELSVTSSGSANTKGSYVEVVASSPFECNSVIVGVTFGGMAGSGLGLLDLATGAAASETVVVPNMLIEDFTGATSYAGCQTELWLTIASSTRISLRYQTTGTNDNGECYVTLIIGGDIDGPSSWTNEGADTSDSGGVQIDPGGSANTKGSYSEIAASTSAVAQAMALQVNCRANTSASSGRWLIDIATGAAASEVVLIPDVRLAVGSHEAKTYSSVRWLTYIASATRLAIRASSSITDATDRLFDAALLIATAPAEPSGGGTHSFVS